MNKFYEHIQTLENELNFIKETYENLTIIQEKREIEHQKLMQQNPYIMKTISKFLGCGYAPSLAIIKTSEEMNIDIKRVRAVYDVNKIGTKHLKKYAQRFLCFQMKMCGFAVGDIAKVANINRRTVYKILSEDFI